MKIIVAHPGQQHSYRVAEALNEKGNLFKYITTVYDSQHSGLMSVVKKLVKREDAKRASGRKSEYLEENKVIQFCEFGGFVTLAILRIDKTKGRIFYNNWNRYISNIFGKRVAKYAIKNNVDAVICYDANSMACFSYLKKHAPNIVRIMDNAAPNRYGLFQEYQVLNKKYHVIDKQPDVFKRFLVDEKEALYYKEEALLAHKHIVASTFSKRMLTSIGVSEKKCAIIPYGFNRTDYVEVRRENTSKLKFLFVGEISAQKGIFNYIDVAKKYKGQVEFHAAGGGIKNLASNYKRDILSFINYHGYLVQSELFELYQEMDVFVFPSLGDGFGFVVLEALSFGLPVICSKNSVGRDIIENGQNGFLFDAGSTDELSKAIQWFIDNKGKMIHMRQAAINSVKDLTWDRYYEELAQKTIAMVESANVK